MKILEFFRESTFNSSVSVAINLKLTDSVLVRIKTLLKYINIHHKKVDEKAFLVCFRNLF